SPMSAAAALSPPAPVLLGRPVIINGEVRVPAEVVDLASFRRWAASDDFPEYGRFSYLNGEIWVDLTMEQLYTHNQVKLAFTLGIGGLLQEDPLGRFFPDGAQLSNPEADLSTVPDGVFCAFTSLDAGRVREIEGAVTGWIELEGTPDMV